MSAAFLVDGADRSEDPRRSDDAGVFSRSNLSIAIDLWQVKLVVWSCYVAQ